MKQILVYGDSLSWGIIPTTRERLAFEQRWPGVLEHGLTARGERVRILEDCLNGRRTVWEDPFKPGRNGLLGLEQRIEMHSPLTLVIILLGSNDFQSMHPHNSFHSAQGIAALVKAVRGAPIEPGMPIPPVLVVVPPPIGTPKGTMAPRFAGGDTKSAGLAEAYRDVCTELECHYFDAGTVVTSSDRDGVHLDTEQHLQLGNTLVGVVAPLLG